MITAVTNEFVFQRLNLLQVDLVGGLDNGEPVLDPGFTSLSHVT